ncbi:MAG: hypothetical protein JWP34_5002 [Massilia sp.]|nr:hypothetical protein [Massilia sp.]
MSADAIAKGVADAEEIDPLGDDVLLDEGLMAGILYTFFNSTS